MESVSIIIPTRDRARLLAETLASVRAQTFPHWQALVVDDGSRDDTRHLVGALSRRDQRIAWLPRTGNVAGAPACRNQGLRHARGEHVVFLDSDDLLAPWALAERVAAMAASPELDFAVFPCELFTARPGDTGLLWNVATDEPDLDRLLRLDVPWQTTGPIWRRQALQRLGDWDESLPSWQDWELHLRALCLGLRYRRFAAVADCYWRQPGAHSIGRQSATEGHLRSHERLLGNVIELLRRTGRWSDRRRRLLAGMHYWLAMAWAELGCVSDAVRAWRLCKTRGLLAEEGLLRQGSACFRLWDIRSLRQCCLEVQGRHWPEGVRFRPSPTFRQVRALGGVRGGVPAATT